MDVSLSAVTAIDIEPVIALARQVWQHTYPGIISQAQIDFMLEQRYNPPRLLQVTSTLPSEGKTMIVLASAASAA